MATKPEPSRRAMLAAAPIAAVAALTQLPAQAAKPDKRAKSTKQAKKAKRGRTRGTVTRVAASTPVSTELTIGSTQPQISCDQPRKGERAYVLAGLYDALPSSITLSGQRLVDSNTWEFLFFNILPGSQTVNLSALCLYVKK